MTSSEPLANVECILRRVPGAGCQSTQKGYGRQRRKKSAKRQEMAVRTTTRYKFSKQVPERHVLRTTPQLLGKTQGMIFWVAICISQDSPKSSEINAQNYVFIVWGFCKSACPCWK